MQSRFTEEGASELTKWGEDVTQIYPARKTYSMWPILQLGYETKSY